MPKVPKAPRKPSAAQLRRAALKENAEMVVSNTVADAWRQFEERAAVIEHLVAAPGESEEELTVRREVAGTLIDKVSGGLHQAWKEFEVDHEHPTAAMQAADARSFHLADIRRVTMEQLTEMTDDVASEVVGEQVTQEKLTGQFNRMGLLQQAAERGVKLAVGIVDDVFNALAHHTFVASSPAAEKDSTEAISSSKDILTQAVDNHLGYVGGKPRHAQHALEQAMAMVMVGHLSDMLELAEHGRPELGGPLRTTGAILTAMGLPQAHIHPNDLVPLSDAAKQTREILEVFEQLDEAITNGALIDRVHEMYTAHYKVHFKGPAPVADRKRYNRAYNRMSDFLDDMQENLEQKVMAYDGWSKPMMEGKVVDALPVPVPLRIQ
jgi:hypothetical protein